MSFWPLQVMASCVYETFEGQERVFLSMYELFYENDKASIISYHEIGLQFLSTAL